MARVTRIELFDDLDGKPVDADDLKHVEFEVKIPGRRAARYALDLRTANVAKFEKALSRYITGATAVRSATTSADAGTHTRAIRAWASAHGYPVAERGRIPADVLKAFNARRH